MFLFDFFTTLQYQNYLIMKNIIILAPLTLIAAGCLPAEDRSNHNNPPVADIPGKAFTVTVCDRQPGIDPDSTYLFYGTLTRNTDDGVVNFTEGTAKGSDYRFQVTPDPVKLIQTGYNEITFETSEDVNASSSDKCIDVKKIDARHFRLVCHQITGSQNSIDEGTARIRFWNGSGDREKSIYINVDARSSVPVEGFEFKFKNKSFMLTELECRKYLDFTPKRFLIADGKELQHAGKKSSGPYPKDDLGIIDHEWDTSKGEVLEFVGTVPRNATPDHLVWMYCDMLSQNAEMMSRPQEFDGYAPFYVWNENKFPGFRWVQKGLKNNDFCLKYDSATKLYPADCRYRKAWIWSRRYYNDPQIPKTENVFHYSTTHEGSERHFWGGINGL